jgi:hypothetical protein
VHHVLAAPIFCGPRHETLPGGGGPGGRVDFAFAIAGSDAAAAAARRLRFDDIKWACDADPDLYPAFAKAFLGGM